MNFDYTTFKIILADLMIFSTLMNIALIIDNMPQSFMLFVTWGIILIISILFLAFFTKNKG